MSDTGHLSCFEGGLANDLYLSSRQTAENNFYVESKNDGANPTLNCSGSPFRRRWFLYGPSLPLFRWGPQHDIGDRHYSPSVAGLIVRKITALSRKQATAMLGRGERR